TSRRALTRSISSSGRSLTTFWRDAALAPAPCAWWPTDSRPGCLVKRFGVCPRGTRSRSSSPAVGGSGCGYGRGALAPSERLWRGSPGPVEARWAAVRDLLPPCDSPAPSALAEACQAAGIRPERAWEEIDKHLERTEPKDAAGFLRHRLYGALARLALLGESG